MNSRMEIDKRVGGKRFEVKKWNSVSIWSWDMTIDTCAICRNPIMDLCINCQSEQGGSGFDEKGCKVAWGTCNHAFHHHCIDKWLQNRQVCPMDNQEWNYQRIGE